MTSLVGPLANLRKVGPWLLPFLSLGGSMLFFLTTNLATWAEGQLYPLTFAGLMKCYAMGLPFVKNTFMADFLGTAILFGLGPVVELAFHRLMQHRSGKELETVPVADEIRGT